MLPSRSAGPPRRRAVVVLVAVLLALAGCSADTDRRIVEGAAEVATDRAFYTLPDPVPAGAPGSIVRTESLPSTMEGSVAWRVLHHTTDQDGVGRVVSAVVVAPTGPAPAGGRPVVGWGHPTTGAVARCAPSSGLDPFDLIEGLGQLLHAGYVVVAADYPGLGVEGQSSYLIGTAEANSVIDAIRAARQLPEAGAGTDVLLWGHSQGGHAALFAGQAIGRYAPELRLRGVAVAAPATELATLLDDHLTDASGVTIGSYSYAAYQAVYGVSLDSILTPAGVAATPAMAQLCLLGQYLSLRKIADPLIGKYVAHDPAVTEPWATLLRQNTPGAEPIGAPVFVAQGEADALVKPAATTQYVSRVCAAGEHVTYRQYPGANHGSIATAAMDDVLPFLAGAVRGAAPASTC